MKSRFAVLFGILVFTGGVFYVFKIDNSDVIVPIESSKTIATDENEAESELVEKQIKAQRFSGRGTSPVAPRNATVTFANGREVDVALRQRTRLDPYFDDTGQFLDIYYDLEVAALDGDARAAIQMVSSLKTCRKAFKTRGDMEQALKRLREDSVLDYPGDNRESKQLLPGMDISSIENQIQFVFDYCEGIGDAETADVEKFARIAIDAGEYMGTRLLTEELGRTREGFDLWQDAWKEGHINGAVSMILFYRDGIPENLDGKPDYVKTYAYHLIANKVYEAASQFSQASNSEMLTAMGDALIGAAGFLTPHEQAEAVELAANLLEANQNCCIGSWMWQE